MCEPVCIRIHVSLRVLTSSHVVRLVHPDGSLADLTMLSNSSVDAALPREEEKQETVKVREGEKEKEEALVVVMDDTDGMKPRSFSDPRRSSTEESRHCSVGTEPEPSTEQSSGTVEQQHNTPLLQYMQHPACNDFNSGA